MKTTITGGATFYNCKPLTTVYMPVTTVYMPVTTVYMPVTYMPVTYMPVTYMPVTPTTMRENYVINPKNEVL